MKVSSSLRVNNAWLRRQTTDHYVRLRQSSSEQYRARSAYKLIELDCGFLTKPSVKAIVNYHLYLLRRSSCFVSILTVYLYSLAQVDLGGAPGGWSQVIARKFGWLDSESAPPLADAQPTKNWRGKSVPARKQVDFGTWSSPLNDNDPVGSSTASQKARKGTVVAVDLLDIAPIPGVYTLKADFLDPPTAPLVHALLCSKDNPEGKADIILSDMAANLTGNDIRDSQSSLEICESVYQFAQKHLRTAEEIGHSKGGVLVYVNTAHCNALLTTTFRIG